MSFMQKIFGAKPQPMVTNMGQPVNPNTQVMQVQPNGANNPNHMNPNPQQTFQSQQTAPNGTIPANAQDNQQQSPLEQHKTLWEPTPADPNAPKPVKLPSAEEIMKATQKVDFKQVMDPTLVAKIKAGGEGSDEAIMALVNQAVQAGYGQSVIASQGLVNKAVEQATAEFQAGIPTLLKTQSAKAALLKENPGFSNPVVAPVVNAMVEQLQTKYPKASSEELTKMAQDVLLGTADVLRPPKKEEENSAQQDNEDWSAYLGEETPFSNATMGAQRH